MGQDVTEQTRHTLSNVAAVLRAAGCTLADVVKVTVYLTNMQEFHAMSQEYAQIFMPPYPARSTVAIRALPLGAQVEVEVVAKIWAPHRAE